MVKYIGILLRDVSSQEYVNAVYIVQFWLITYTGL